MWKKVLLVLSMLYLAACGKKDPNVLVMGTDANFPPFEYVENGEIRGFSVDLAQLLAQKLQKKLKVENIGFSQLLLSISRSKVDFAIASITVTPERRQQFDFTDSYFKSVQSILVPKNSKITVNNADDLGGKKIGVQLGTTGQLFAQDIEGTTVVPFDDPATAVMDLQNGKLDVVLIDRDVATKLARNYSGVSILGANFIKEEYAIAVPKSNPTLLAELNRALRELKAEGALQMLFSKYFTIEVK